MIRPAARRRQDRRRGGVLKHLLIPLGVAVATLILSWMLLLPGLLSARLERDTGFALSSGRLMANPLSGHIRLTDADIANPAGFPGTPFLRIARLETTARPWTLRDHPIILPRVVLDIDTLTLVLGADGSRNLSLWDAGYKRLGINGQPPLRIGVLELSVARVVVADYTRGAPPRLTEYHPEYRRVHRDVTDWAPVWNEVLGAATTR